MFLASHGFHVLNTGPYAGRPAISLVLAERDGTYGPDRLPDQQFRAGVAELRRLAADPAATDADRASAAELLREGKTDIAEALGESGDPK